MGELDPALESELAEIAMGRWDGQPLMITFDLDEAVTEDALAATGISLIEIEEAGDPQEDFEPLRIATAFATPAAIARLAEMDGVGWIDTLDENEDELIYSRQASKTPVQITGDTPPKFIDKVTGVGTVIGIVDGSIDVFHSAFRKEDGKTRIRALWAQNMKPFKVRVGPRRKRQKKRRLIPPAPFLTGCYFDEDVINFALGYGSAPSGFKERHRRQLRRRLLRAAGFNKGGTRRSDHGSHVAGIAAGSGRKLVGNPAKREIGDFIGIAPQASIVCVIAGGRASVRRSIKFFHHIAPNFGVPAAINASLGWSRGPHVVQWPSTRRVAQAVRQVKGTTTVMSAGNYGSARGHVGGMIKAGQKRTVELKIDTQKWKESKLDNIVLELWGGYKTGGTFEFSLIPPGATRRVKIKPKQRIDRLRTKRPYFVQAQRMKGNPDLNGIYLRLPRRNRYGGTWKLEIKCTNAPNPGTDWHAWLSIPVMKAQIAELTGASNSTTMNALVPAATVSVGALKYDVVSNQPRNFRVANFSSRGPLPDGKAFPTLVAPGYTQKIYVQSAVIPAKIPSVSAKRGWDTIGSKLGTSMAAPHVAGTVALLKQIHAGFDQETVKKILVGGATERPVGSPENTWGAGSLNIEDALDLATLYVP